ncbi:Endonuclease/exonuclease/phosphatase [Schizophyllum commune]
MHPHHQLQQHHHHQASLSHYPSPPNVNQLPLGSPVGQLLTSHWNEQLIKCEMIRSSRSPHHRARANAIASRTVTKSAVPITNPNLIKAPPETNGKDPETNGRATPNPSEMSPSHQANHPSSTAAPVKETPRPTAARPPQGSWNSLDMGGIQIKNIPPTSGLFSFTFLTNLYLNHNALTSVPPQLSKLRHLELLDLSGNQLTAIPPELGMITSLKEFYVFDNQITTIPPELGTLHQLRTLGIEGNPLDMSIKSVIQKDGTQALIANLRDSCPVPAPAPDREWKDVSLPSDPVLDHNAETFSVLCYNILCDKYATEKLYGYTPSWALAWDYRKELILKELVAHQAEFVCLQEIDVGQFEDYFLKHMMEHGYEAVFWPKPRARTMGEAERRTVDGCATFYRSDRFKLVEKHLVELSAVAMQRSDFIKTDIMFNRLFNKEYIAVVCCFEDRSTGTRFIVANAHMFWNADFCDVKLVQVGMLMDELEKIAHAFARYPPPLKTESGQPPPSYSDGTKIPTIVCGDYNSVPRSGVYEYLSAGSLPPDHPDFLGHSYGRYTEEGMRHRFGLRSAYALPGPGPGAELLPMTNYTPSFQGVIDYIWYSAPTVAVQKVLGEVDRSYLEKVVGFPNAHFPSDHLAILAQFRVKSTRS